MKIALVGNQNSGKTTLFNLLTGSNQKIGNWPGVTIEKKEGIISGTDYTLIDLPGIYSLSPYSVDEELSVKYILENKLDLIINVVDVNCLERGLYLTTQLMELDCKVIVALSMTNLLKKDGLSIDIKKLEKILEIPIIDINTKKDILKETISAINKAKLNNISIFSYDIELILSKLVSNFNYNKKYNSIELLKNNEIYCKTLEEKYNCDIMELLASKRYKYIDSIVEMVIKGSKKKKINILDKIFVNRFLGIPLFILIMMFIYYVAIGLVGDVSSNILSTLISLLNQNVDIFLKSINASEWLISLINNGIINGVGSVLNFLPQLCILFLLIEILEQTGYMARISFILDRFFSKLGLSGKSLIPFIMGLGCSVPGIMATRIIDDKTKREKTIFLTPFIPCSAKLSIVIIVSNYFFPNNRFFASFMYLFAVLIVILSSIILKKIYFVSESQSYIMELPTYKIPNFHHVIKEVSDKIKSFIKRAGSVILISSIIIWLMLSLSPTLDYTNSIENSILCLIGKKISWIFYPFIGMRNWAVSVSIIQGIIAKEQVVSSMSIIANAQNNVFSGKYFAFFTPISALSFLTFNLFSIPCFNTIITMKKELGSLRKLILALLFQLIIAFLISTIIYQIGMIIW